MSGQTQEEFLSRGGDQNIERDRWGRPLVIPPGGGKPVGYTRCTTFVDVMEDRTNLEKWKMRGVAVGLSVRPDLLLRVSSIGPDEPTDASKAKVWKAQHNEAADSALEAAKTSAKATIGTSLHTYTEKIDRGQPVGPVPADYVKHLKSYEAATRNLTARYIEQFTVYDPLQIGGTPDRIVEVDGQDGLFIADVKSGSISFPNKMAMQLAVYAHSLVYNPITGERTDPGNVNLERGIVIALDQQTGACQLHWIELTRAWGAVQIAAQVRLWRKEKNLTKPFLSVVPEQAPAPLVEATAKPEHSAEVYQRHLHDVAEVAKGLAAKPSRFAGPVVEVPATFPLTAPEVAAALEIASVGDPATLAALVAGINNAATADELKKLWSVASGRGMWTAEHTALASARKKALGL